MTSSALGSEETFSLSLPFTFSHYKNRSIYKCKIRMSPKKESGSLTLDKGSPADPIVWLGSQGAYPVVWTLRLRKQGLLCLMAFTLLDLPWEPQHEAAEGGGRHPGLLVSLQILPVCDTLN